MSKEKQPKDPADQGKEIKTAADLIQDENNYRKHSDTNKARIKKSIDEAGLGRSVVIDADGVLVAGNGVQQVIDKDTPVRVIETDGTELVVVKRTDLHTGDPRRKTLALADNATADDVEWDFEAIAEDWTEDEAGDWGVEWHDELAEKKSVCDMVSAERIRSYGDISVHCSFKKSKKGKSLSEIKAEKENIKVFADAFVSLARKVAGFNSLQDWCLVTAPKRRHKEENFAEAVCKEISEKIGLKFYPDLFTCKDRTRILPIFTMEYEISENNVVLYDDIITTGSTIRAMADILRIKGKNVLYFAGILND